MNFLRFTSPESLEQRIAPAGVVAVSFANGLLTISGADGADHNVEVLKTGTNQFRVQGTGTDVNVVGESSKDFTGVLKHVVITGGVGADNFQLTKLSPLKSLRFDGDAGTDSLSTTKLRTHLGGKVVIDLGSGTGSVDFAGGVTTVDGPLKLKLGGGGTVSFGSGTTTVGGNVVVTGGIGSDSVAITGATTVFKRDFTFLGADGNDSFNATGDLLRVRGVIAMDGGADTDSFSFGADATKVGTRLAPSLIDLKLGAGSGAVTFSGNATKVFGDVKIDLGSGGGVARFDSAVTTLLGDVQVKGGAGNDTLAFNGRTTIGKGLSFVGDTGDEVLTATGASFAVKGAFNVDGGSGASSFSIDVVSLELGSLTIVGGTANDTMSIIADGTIAGDLNVALGLDGTGPSSTVLQSRAGLVNGLKVGGSVGIDMVGATVDVLTIANLQVARAFVAKTGENVSTVSITNLDVNGSFRLETGAGADVVNIDNIATRDFYIDTQSGADELRIERNPSFLGQSQITGIATIILGAGADQIRIGNSSDPVNLSVSFKRAVTIDAGDGANMRNDILASNLFKFAPTIIATGGTFTQTEAV